MATASSRVCRVEVAGPLAPFADAYGAELRSRGYAPLTMVNQLRQLARLSCWLDAHRLSAGQLSGELVGRFVGEQRAEGCTGSCSLQGLLVLLDVLRRLGVVEPERPVSGGSASDLLLASFRVYLLEERGLAACTADAYTYRARRFLGWLPVERSLAGVDAGDVTRAVLRESAAVSASSTQHFVAALRSFLRFCFVEGLVEADLSAAALGVTGRMRSSLPMGISTSDAAALLACCDRRRAMGRRDHAVIITLLRLGLRASEVAGLTLDEIDWRAGEIVVRGKGRRQDRLPLPADVGEAIAGYLRRGRPIDTGRREVFLRALAPTGGLGRGGISTIVRSACVRAGIPAVGPHRLRHTMACEMVNAGVPLPEIGQVLRHRSLVSTANYARVDLDRLRLLAQPWPGVTAR